MRALVLTDLVGAGGLELREVDAPTAPAGGVVVKVGAAGVNYPDLLAMRGEYQVRTPVPFVPGNEVAGTVVATGPGSEYAVGDRVMALCGTGGYAELVAVADDLLVRTPEPLDDAHAVALVANHQTAYFSLAVRAGLSAGDRVVVLGAAGGLGSASVQVAAAMGARVVAVVHREGAADFVRGLGAESVVRLAGDWGREVKAVLGAADVLVDPVGGDAFDAAVRVMAPGGRLVVVGFAGGDIPQLKVNRLLLRNIAVVGAGWGEWLRTSPESLTQIADGVAGLVRNGLRPPVTGRYPLDRGHEAIEALASGGVRGKVVIEP